MIGVRTSARPSLRPGRSGCDELDEYLRGKEGWCGRHAGPSASAAAWGSEAVEQSKEDAQLRSPGKESQQEPSAGAYHLSGDVDDGVDEGAKLHA